MKLSKQDKKDLSAKLADEFESEGSVFFTSFQGLKFKDLQDLRSRLQAQAKGRFRVMRNVIISHALKGTKLKEWENSNLLEGPVAYIALKGDPVAAAKVLVNFGKDFPALKIKGGFYDFQGLKKWVSADECKRLSAVGTRHELLGKLASVFYSSVAGIAGVLQAPMRDFVLVLSAVKDKKNKTGGMVRQP